MKVMTVVGTRPEIIRLSRVLDRLDRSVEHVLVHTGQNWDYQLNGVFFDELGLRAPDHFLEVDTSSLGATLGDIIKKTEEVLQLERPDAFLVLGDTNSAISSIMARRMQIPVFHMEAGNRCFDQNVPEETNRRIVDHTADFNLVYTEHARRNLLAEGLHPERIMLTGSPMREVLDHYGDAIRASSAASDLGLEERGYFLVSAHREETVDHPDRLRALVSSLNALGKTYGLPILVSTHPRTRKRINADRLLRLGDPLRFHEPFGFYDYNKLQLDAKCVLSDSGTISEECAILGFPAVTLRDAIERPESLDAGSIIKVGVEEEDVLRGVVLAIGQWEEGSRAQSPADYSIENTSQRVISFIVSSTPAFRSRAGLRPFAGTAGRLA